MSESPDSHKRRVRLLYSLKDVQLALSAADFLLDCDPEEKISKVQLRRYKCYESTAILAYARPFSASRGGFPRLSLEMINVQLHGKREALHKKILELRNRAIAHSDAEMMRMAVQLHELDIGSGESMPYVVPTFDEGLEFAGSQHVSELLALFKAIYAGIFRTIMEDASSNPGKLDFRHDYLDLDKD